MWYSVYVYMYMYMYMYSVYMWKSVYIFYRFFFFLKHPAVTKNKMADLLENWALKTKFWAEKKNIFGVFWEETLIVCNSIDQLT